MAYQIKCDAPSQVGLLPALSAMRGLTIDLRLADSETVNSGSIVRVDPFYQPNPEVVLVAVDLHGRPIEDGVMRAFKVSDIAEVAVW